MRILHIIPYFYPAWAYGGTCRAAWELARALARKGQEVLVCTTDALDSQQRATPTVESVDGVQIYRTRNFSNQLAWNRLFLPLGFGLKLWHELKRVDVAHLHEFRSYQNAVAYPLLRAQHVPFVLTAQGGMPRIMGRYQIKALYDWLVGQAIVRHASRLHALNELEHRQFVELNVHPERIAVLPNGINVEEYYQLPDPSGFREKYAIPAEAPVVLFLARINKIKGVDFLVSSFARVQAQVPNAILLIVGPDDGFLPEIKRQIQQLGIEANVRFAGYLAGTEKLQAYQTANVYVLPSSYEMFAITLLESLACGTPIIATDRCGLADYVRQHDLGAIVTYGETDQLQQEIIHAIQEPTQLKIRAAHGRQYVLERFGWDHIAERWLDVYQECRAQR
jgi:glycosyltransferase involved in cell wall biosynthesis